ncbi:MAG: carbohydrate-binding domain-containing protein [Pseudomonadota bacterium]
MKRRLSLGIALCTIGLTAGCGADVEESPYACPTDDTGAVEGVHAEDPAWDSAAVTVVALDGDRAEIDGPGATSEGSTVRITTAGTYVLSGSFEDGQIVVDAGEDDVRVVLDDAEIACSSSAPLYVASAGDVEVFLAEDTHNRLVDGAVYVFEDGADEPDAALFSEADLVFSGPGALEVVGRFNDGIASKDDLVIVNGDITVTAMDDGLRGRDSVEILGGRLQIAAGGDGLKTTNDEDTSRGWVAIEAGRVRVTAGGDAISAVTEVTVAGGLVVLEAGGGAEASISEDLSAKGIKGSAKVSIEGGIVRVDAADDGVHSDGDIAIGGGAICIGTGDDGVHAEGEVEVTGGDLVVTRSYEGLEAAIVTIEGGTLHLRSSDDGVNVVGAGASSGGGGGMGGGGGCEDCQFTIRGGSLFVDADGDGIDSNGAIAVAGGLVVVHGPTEQMNSAVDAGEGGTSFQISGGTLVAAGSAGMAVAADESSAQCSVLAFLDGQDAGTVFHIQTAGGDEVLTFAPRKDYESVLFSTPALGTGEYEILLGGSVSGNSQDGLYLEGGYRAGSKEESFEIVDASTQVGEGGGFAMGGSFGRPGAGCAAVPRTAQGLWVVWIAAAGLVGRRGRRPTRPARLPPGRPR